MVTARKRLAVVAATLFILLGVVIGVAMASQVHAEESAEEFVTETSETQSVSGTDAVESDGSEVELTKEEIPLAEAKASVLEAETPEKGMPSILGFGLVALAAAAAGIAVALRAKIGKQKRCYQPAKDLTIFKIKK